MQQTLKTSNYVYSTMEEYSNDCPDVDFFLTIQYSYILFSILLSNYIYQVYIYNMDSESLDKSH